MPGSRTGSNEGRRARFGLKSLSRAFHRASGDAELPYHFYVLGPGGEILRSVNRRLPDDETAMTHARLMLTSAETVEVLRGALVIGRVRRRAA